MIKIKKLKSISETEKRTDIIIDDPKFKNWFKGSKVVDKQGRPLVCFHGTKVTFNSFRPLSHFGTIDAASEFVDNYVYSSYNSNITPVYLSIKNPLKIKDSGESPSYLIFDIFFLKLITISELLEILPKNDETTKLILNDYDKLIERCKKLDIIYTDEFLYKTLKDKIKDIVYNNWTDFSKFSTENLIKILSKKGYDGLYYENELEDKGSISWIIFYSEQVWPIFKNSEDEQLNEIEVFHDENNETEREKLYYAKKALNKNLPEKEFKGYTFKIWEDSDTIDYLMTIDGKLVGMFAFEIVNGFNAITYRWIDSNYRGKGLYSIFLQFLKSIGISKIVSDQLMTQAAINSTLKLKNKVQFINVDTKEILPINQENISKYITNDYDEETFPWRFLITI